MKVCAERLAVLCLGTIESFISGKVHSLRCFLEQYYWVTVDEMSFSFPVLFVCSYLEFKNESRLFCTFPKSFTRICGVMVPFSLLCLTNLRTCIVLEIQGKYLTEEHSILYLLSHFRLFYFYSLNFACKLVSNANFKMRR